jgi:hypothetical protein
MFSGFLIQILTAFTEAFILIIGNFSINSPTIIFSPEFQQSRGAPEGNDQAEPSQDRHRGSLQRSSVRPPKSFRFSASRKRIGTLPFKSLNLSVV